MALTGELLRAVADGRAPATARVFIPGPTLAFGRLDAREPGFDAASDAARLHGFLPLVRHAGGRAAPYDSGCVVIETVVPSSSITNGVEDRFAAMASLLQRALADIGVETEIGELPGEFCPGRYSVHASGRKISGVAQRSVVGASLTTAVVAVQGGDRLRSVLVDVQRALGFEWNPETVGSADEFAPDLTPEAVIAALQASLS
jgi:lipoate-protein ligase A